MPKIKYQNFRISEAKQAMIDKCNKLIATYSAQGYSLTLRQLYYQFVSRDWLPAEWADPNTGSTNNQKSYDKLGIIVGDGRMAGLIDWNAIEDRTRNIDGNTHWTSPASIIRAVANQYQIDKWQGQEYMLEVWVEKDALENVVSKAARAADVPYFSCRGYGSLTALWDAGQRLKSYVDRGQTPVILHLGDHDPSGIDMTRDITDRLRTFMDGEGESLIVDRIALNMPQVKQYDPPANPAKVTDCRYDGYCERFGVTDSWELDAIEPAVLEQIINDNIGRYLDNDAWTRRAEKEADEKRLLMICSDNWHGKVADLLKDLATPDDEAEPDDDEETNDDSEE